MKKEKTAWFYLKGHGHVWRVNDQGMFQRGDTYEEFDRWALCSDIHEETIPQTEKQFKNFVKQALRVDMSTFVPVKARSEDVEAPLDYSPSEISEVSVDIINAACEASGDWIERSSF